MIPEHCMHTGKPLRRLFLRENPQKDFYQSEEGVVYYAGAHSVSYDQDYFLKEYENQYGKTYTQDETNLRKLARRRIDFLISKSGMKTGKGSRKMLEIGCAAGYFLDEARQAGFDVTGNEISEWGKNHTEKLGIPVYGGSFADLKFSGFDVIAAFFVIEHHPDQKTAFETISNMLKSGGYLILALPSTNGPTMRCNPAEFARTHPADHFADYSPHSLAITCRLYGLNLVAARPLSFHQYRDCGLLARLPSLLYNLYSKHRVYSDTMECIFRKA